MTNEELVERIRAGDADILMLWRQMKRFILKMANRYKGQAEIDDLMQESFFALNDAVRLWEPERKITFAHYLVFWLKRYWADCCECSATIRVPRNQRAAAYRYHKMVSEYRRDFGRDPDRHEVCNALELTEGEYNNVLCSVSAQNIKSMDDETGTLVVDEYVDVEAEALNEIERETIKEKLWAIVDRLPEQHAKTIRSRYQDNKTLEECGADLGVSLERVRQLEFEALRKLRSETIAKQIEPYLDETRYSLGIAGGGVRTFRDQGFSSTEKAALKAIAYLEQLEKDGLI